MAGAVPTPGDVRPVSDLPSYADMTGNGQTTSEDPSHSGPPAYAEVGAPDIPPVEGRPPDGTGQVSGNGDAAPGGSGTDAPADAGIDGSRDIVVDANAGAEISPQDVVSAEAGTEVSSQDVVSAEPGTGESRGDASGRRPSATLALLIARQLQFLAMLSLVEYVVVEDSWLADFVIRLRYFREVSSLGWWWWR